MNVTDGRRATLYWERLTDTCTHPGGCDARGVTVFGGALRCIGHAIGPGGQDGAGR